jgi:hypothetical protein
MKLSIRYSHSAVTLLELMLSLAAGAIILASVLTAGVALQRSFAASESYSTTAGDQLRVLDYIAMDCRRALAASISGNVLTLTLPVYYNSASSNVPNNPVLASGALSYGSGSVTVIYAQSGSNFTRQVVVRAADGTTRSDTTTAIARNVATFTVTPRDLTSSLSCAITFSPKFTFLASANAIAGTTVYCNTFLRNAGARQ